MSRLISVNADLAQKYAVGEIVDMAGVPSFYDAGTSKWMNGTTWYPRSQVGAAVANVLSQNPENGALTQAVLPCGETYSPMAVVGSVSIRHCNFSSSGAISVYTNTGIQNGMVTLGGSSYVYVVSDGTSFYAVRNGGVSPNSTTGIAKSTDGITWTPQTISWPVSRQFGNNATYANQETALGMTNNNVADKGCIFWAGARFIAICTDATNFYALRSTNGTAWTDDSTAIMGVASITGNNEIRYSREGNNVFLSVGGANRFSADGGGTWAAVTGISLGPTNALQKSLDGKVLLQSDNTMPVSMDSGQTWVARQTAMGFNATSICVCKVGALYTLAAVNSANAKRSTDGGATWTNIVLPAGVSGTIATVYSDGTVLYLITSLNQLLLSTDSGATWTLRASFAISFSEVVKAVRLSANTVVFATASTASYTAYTTDNGVSWRQSVATSISATPSTMTCAAVTSTTVPYFIGADNRTSQSSSYAVSEVELIAGTQFVRASPGSPTALRGGTTAKIRVA